VLGYPPSVLNKRVAKVLAEAKMDVEEPVLATRVASPVDSLKVYKPKRIKEVPEVSVPAEATLIELTVVVQPGVKKVK
jgi:hypothetical protein